MHHEFHQSAGLDSQLTGLLSSFLVIGFTKSSPFLFMLVYKLINTPAINWLIPWPASFQLSI